jgi:hypothetical protein
MLRTTKHHLNFMVRDREKDNKATISKGQKTSQVPTYTEDYKTEARRHDINQK